MTKKAACASFNWGNGLGLLGLISTFALLGLRTVPVHAAPFAYVTNYGSNTVSVVDTATNSVSATIQVGLNPFGVAVHPDGTRVYVTNRTSGTASVIDTSTNTVAATIRVGLGPDGVAVHPNGTKVYVANELGGTVSVIDTATSTVIATIEVGTDGGGGCIFPIYGPAGVAVHPDGTRVYVAHICGGSVLVIDAATNTVTATIPTQQRIGDWPFTGFPFGVAVSPDGTRVYVTTGLSSYGMHTVQVIDAASNSLIDVIPLGEGAGPGGVAVHPDGTRTYTANNDYGGVTREHTVSVIDANGDVIAIIPVGRSDSFPIPLGVAVHPDGTRVYVPNRENNALSVIDTETNVVIATIPVGTLPVAFGQFISPGVTTKLAYYGLGDSVASGHGLPGGTGQVISDPCRQSPEAYPHRVFDQLKLHLSSSYELAPLKHLACSGAQSYNTGTQKVDLPEQIAQVLQELKSAPSNQVTIVSITIGADDVEFVKESLFGTDLCLAEPFFNSWINGIAATLHKNLLSHVLTLLQKNPNVYVVLTDYYNPFNRKSDYFQLMGFTEKLLGHRACRLLSDEELYDRTEVVVQKLNSAISNAVVNPTRVILAPLHGTFQGHESPHPYCGTDPSSPTIKETFIQYPAQPLYVLMKELVAGVLEPPAALLRGDDCFHPNETGADIYGLVVTGAALQLLKQFPPIAGE